MVNLIDMLYRLKPAKILVIGDLLLDTYTRGHTSRISPEAPVVIINVRDEEHRPGGAGNVALNLLSLGAQVAVVGRVGNDWAGEKLSSYLQHEHVNLNGLVVQYDYSTPIKNRIIADNQQIVRIDREEQLDLSATLEQEIIDRLTVLLQGIAIIAISDYGKGFLTQNLLRKLIDKATELQIPVITDPKGRDFKKYKGTTLIKPNLSEAYAAVNMPSHASLEIVAEQILNQTNAKLVMVTRSENGISLFDNHGKLENFHVHAKEVKDVTGAGDTVLAMLTYALANHLSPQEAALLCNAAAGIAIETVGCARVTISDLAVRLFNGQMMHKVFDLENIFILQTSMHKESFNLMLVEHNQQMTHALLLALRQAASEKILLVHINSDYPPTVLIDMLISLREVKAVVTGANYTNIFTKLLQPYHSYYFDMLSERAMLLELIDDAIPVC